MDYAISCKANDAAKLIADIIPVDLTGNDDAAAIACLQAALKSVQATPAERIAKDMLQGIATPTREVN